MSYRTPASNSTPRPRRFLDRRSVETGAFGAPSLHAKWIVVDDRRALVTSANLTAAAQARNLGLGVLIDDAARAVGIRQVFDSLVARRRVERLPGF